MRKIMYLSIVLVLCVLAFWAGAKWKRYNLGDMSTYKLLEEITLQASPGKIGTLPPGSIIYKYRAKSETVTYIVFLNMKNQMVIEPVELEKINAISPLSGYQE
ncbi:hypothetical protein ACVBEJ_14210 [Porticoccus sp. GXU_MW_L64]